MNLTGHPCRCPIGSGSVTPVYAADPNAPTAATERKMAFTDAPMKPPHDERLAEPDMTETQIRQWIEACNHEPARRVLRGYLMMANAGLDPRPEISRLRMAVRVAFDALKSLPEDALGYGQDDDGRWPLRDELMRNLDEALTPAPLTAA